MIHNSEKVTDSHVSVKARREYKDNLFRMLFNNKEMLLSLYNAVNGTDYVNSDELDIVTLENAIYMNMKNDIAFVMDFYLNLYEHQSTFNPNMPLRNLFYAAKEYQKLIEDKSLYVSTRVRIPTPKFLVFYNGAARQPERMVLKLSDSFEKNVKSPDLELKVTMLNINSGSNEKLKESCRLLKEYELYVERVRDYAGKMELNEAVERAVEECIAEGILKGFLTKYRAEAISVSIFEYNEEKEKELMRQAEYAAGEERGEKKGEKRFASLTKKLLEAGRADELLHAADNVDFRNALYREYKL